MISTYYADSMIIMGGMYLMMAFLHLLLAIQKDSREDNLSFAFLNLFAFAYTILFGWMSDVETVEHYLFLWRIQIFLTSGGMISFIWFGEIFSGHRQGKLRWVLTVFWFLLPFFRLQDKWFWLFESVKGLQTTTLPWDEHLVALDGNVGLSGYFFYCAVLCTIFFVFFRVVNYTKQTYRHQKQIALTLLLIYLTVVVYDMVVIGLNLPWMQLAPVSGLSLFILLSLSIIHKQIQSKRLEKKMAVHSQRLNLAMETMEAGLWDWNIKTGKLLISDKGVEALGYLPEEFSPLDWAVWKERCHPDDREAWIKTLKDHCAGKLKLAECELRMKHKTGGWIWGLNRGKVIKFDRSGAPLRMTGIFLNITDKKKSERALLKSEKKYKTLFEKSHEAIFVIGKKTGHILDANDAAVELTGRPRADITESHVKEICPQWAGLISDSRDASSWEIPGKIIYTRPTGEQRTTRSSLVSLDDENIVGITRDITEEIAMDERLRQSQKMEAIGTLAGGIAHDFNNILSGILGYSRLAKMNLDNPEQSGNYIDQVIGGINRAAELVRQILTFSRQTEYRKMPFAVFYEVNEALKFLRASIPANIHILKELDSRTKVMADPIRIYQLLMNLCTNAYHAMEKTGGRLTVSLTDEEILAPTQLKDKLIPPGKYVRLQVKDTGSGMDEQTLKKVFDPYFTTKKIGRGTGLGLSLVQAIVDEHEGYLNVETEPFMGSRFSVYLPAAENKISPQLAENPDSGQLNGNESIMLVDDDADIRQSQKELFADHGYKIHIFLDAEKALTALCDAPEGFDLIITDLSMPGIGGDVFAKKVQGIRPGIPIILCTGFPRGLSKFSATKMGIRRLVQKPVDGRELIRLTRKFLDERENLSENRSVV